MRPYYESDGVKLYLGDSREILEDLEPVESVITDPTWPNAVSELFGADDPAGMFRDVARHFPQIAKRVVVQLGCDSDPRFLASMPDMPFLRTCWLEYVRPHYKGRLLYTGDVAYVFGEWPKSKKGAHVLPGRTIQHDSSRRPDGHPCPRQLAHVRWLCHWFGGASVLDPCLGSGTTALACIQLGIPFVGVEVEERYLALAAERIEREPRPLEEVV